MKKTIRSLICGLGAALLLLTCLPAAALAAEKQAGFSSMFPGYADGAKDPRAAEAVLANMGTLIGQSRTVKGVTLTLDGAIWNEDKVLLSFAIEGAGIPKDIPNEIYFNRDVMSVTLAEGQREAYVRSKIVERETFFPVSRAPLTQEELDANVQDRLKRGEPDLFHLPRLVRSGGKDRLVLSVSLLPYVEQPELTVHIESLALFKNAEGKYWSRPYDGYEPIILASGPFDFTFTVEKHQKPLVYTGAVDVTVEGIPLQVKRVVVTAFGAEAECETLQKLDLQNDYMNETKKLYPIRLSGVWTKDGLSLKGVSEANPGGDIFTPDARLEKAWVTTGNTHPYAIDPASVTAVDIGGVRVDLNKLTLQENPPLQYIQTAHISPAAERKEPTAAEKAAAEQAAAKARAEHEKQLEEAKKIAYEDLNTASKEMQAKILEARKVIINSASWAADGWTAYTVDENGNKTQLPHFSDLFPGWEMPKA